MTTVFAIRSKLTDDLLQVGGLSSWDISVKSESLKPAMYFFTREDTEMVAEQMLRSNPARLSADLEIVEFMLVECKTVTATMGKPKFHGFLAHLNKDEPT